MQPAARFAVRALVHPYSTFRLLRYFEHVSSTFPSRSIRVDSLLKVGREHVRRGLRAADRADMLIAHYATLAGGMSEPVRRRFFDREPIRLASLSGRDMTDEYDIWIYQVPYGYRREGEATLSLRARASGLRLADVTFAFGATQAGGLCLRIGGLQGPPAPHGKDAVKAATKALDGLRPKAVAVEAVYQLGRHFGVRTVFATSLAHHVLYGKKAASMTVGPYDAFWEEMGGVRLASGDYLLPATPPHRDAADVPAKRRKDWERRQLRLAALTDEIERTLVSLLGAAFPIGREPEAAAAVAVRSVVTTEHAGD